MTDRHTPGPWIVIENETRTDDMGYSVAELNISAANHDPFNFVGQVRRGHWDHNGIWYPNRAGEESRANARLMAHSPDLLIALRWLVDAVDGDPSEFPDGGRDLTHALEEARDLLARLGSDPILPNEKRKW